MRGFVLLYGAVSLHCLLFFFGMAVPPARHNIRSDLTMGNAVFMASVPAKEAAFNTIEDAHKDSD